MAFSHHHNVPAIHNPLGVQQSTLRTPAITDRKKQSRYNNNMGHFSFLLQQVSCKRITMRLISLSPRPAGTRLTVDDGFSPANELSLVSIVAPKLFCPRVKGGHVVIYHLLWSLPHRGGVSLVKVFPMLVIFQRLTTPTSMYFSETFELMALVLFYRHRCCLKSTVSERCRVSLIITPRRPPTRIRVSPVSTGDSAIADYKPLMRVEGKLENHYRRDFGPQSRPTRQEKGKFLSFRAPRWWAYGNEKRHFYIERGGSTRELTWASCWNDFPTSHWTLFISIVIPWPAAPTVSTMMSSSSSFEKRFLLTKQHTSWTGHQNECCRIFFLVTGTGIVYVYKRFLTPLVRWGERCWLPCRDSSAILPVSAQDQASWEFGRL